MFALPVAGLAVLLPLLAAVVLAAVPASAAWGRAAAWISAAAATATFGLTCLLPWQLGADWWPVDRLASHLAMLTGFVAMVATWPCVVIAGGRARFSPALFQAMAGCLLLALLGHGFAIGWIGAAGAVVVGAAATAAGGTEAGVVAGWKLLILGGVGLGLALFGVVALHAAAVPRTGSAALANLAWVGLLLGYGGLAGLVPLSGWHADAQAAAPAPVAALLGPGLANVGFAMLLRGREAVAAHAGVIPPGWALLGLGLLTLLGEAAWLWRRDDGTRFFIHAGIGLYGVVAFAFGLGGEAACFAGLLLLTVLALLRTMLVRGGGLAALGLFAPVFLVVMATAQLRPWLLLPLGIGLLATGWAVAGRTDGTKVTLAPAWLGLGLALLLGLAMPPPAVAWFAAIAGSVR